MGLDMYLNASRYLSSYNEADKEKKTTLLEMFPELKVYLTEDSNPINEVSAEIGYWRKANAIHGWFVDNVQEGEDDCKKYFVNREDLETLKSICERVLADHSLAEELLPGRQGFFFGNTEFDDFYFGDLEATVRIIDLALALPVEWNIHYQSSW
jgi:hypothetical protein